MNEVSVQSESVDDNEYLTFLLAGEEYGIDILRVQEIRGWSPVTEMPNTPSYLRGVINLRGVIVPIVDLRERFNRPLTKYDATTVVIVLRTTINAVEVVVGIVVDAVSDVYKVDDKNVKPAPNFGSSVDSQFLTGMATIGEKIIILLCAEKLLDAEELYKVKRLLNQDE